MALMLKNARLIDPQIGLDEVADILIRDGKIVEVGHDLTMEKGVERDLSGKIVTPGLVDMHVHFRDPGQEQKEDIASGSRAAAHGGFTAVCTMPNTSPVVDDAVAVEYVKARAAAVGKCRVVVAGACSKDLKGEVLSDMGDMYAHGAPVFTDDGHGIQDAGMMRRVMDYANQFDTVIMAHCQDDSLVADSQVNEGVASTRLGMVGWPAEGEELEIARDIALCRLTGCPLHIQHITTKRGLDLVAAAKAEGLPVTCEVTPHHMFLTEDAITAEYQTALKVNPPLRTAEDAAALIEGLANGTIDAIVTDHAPHTDWEKDREFELAPFGMTGLETAEYLSSQGNQVSVYDLLPEVAAGEHFQNIIDVEKRLEHVPQHTGHRLVEITGEGCLFEDTAAGKEVKVPCDAVVLAMGMRPNQGIADQFRSFPNCQAIGTCVAYGNIACAVESGFLAAYQLD